MPKEGAGASQLLSRSKVTLVTQWHTQMYLSASWSACGPSAGLGFSVQNERHALVQY